MVILLGIFNGGVDCVYSFDYIMGNWPDMILGSSTLNCILSQHFIPLERRAKCTLKEVWILTSVVLRK